MSSARAAHARHSKSLTIVSLSVVRRSCCWLIAVSTFWRRTSWWTTERPFASPLSSSDLYSNNYVACYISFFLYHKLKGGCGGALFELQSTSISVWIARERLIMLIELSGKSWLESRLWLYSFFNSELNDVESPSGRLQVANANLLYTWLFLSAFQMSRDLAVLSRNVFWRSPNYFFSLMQIVSCRRKYRRRYRLHCYHQN